MLQETRVEGREQLVLGHGVFTFAAGVTVDTSARERTILEVGARFRPGPARHEAAVKEGTFPWQHIAYAKPVGSTALDILFVEIRERGRTIALLGTPGSPETLNGNRATFSAPMNAKIANWSDVEILFHVRAHNDDTRASDIPRLKTHGRGTILWKPANFDIVLREAMEHGVPPRPAELRVVGAGLTAVPESPFVGDTFTAVILLRNSGELPLDASDYRWTYGDAAATGRFGSLSGGADTRLAFSAAAQPEAREIGLAIGTARFTATIAPIRQPHLDLLSVQATPTYAEEPLDLALVIANTGSGPASDAEVRLTFDGGDTLVKLAELPVSGPIGRRIAWSDSFPLDFDLSVRLTDESTRESTAVLPIHRRPRPRARFAADQLEFAGPCAEGMPGRFHARVRNDGDLASELTLLLDVSAPGGDSPLASRRFRAQIGPGQSAEFLSDIFAYRSGLLRGSILGPGFEEFTQIDVAPRDLDAGAENGLMMHAVDETATPRVTRVVSPILFRFAPIEDLEEFDSSATLVVPVQTWPMTPGGTPLREDAVRPSLAVWIDGAGLSDRFDVASTETITAFAVARAMLADTFTVRIEPIGSSPAWLVGAPVLRLVAAAPEYARVTAASARAAGVMATVQNAARYFDVRQATVAVAYEGEPDSAVAIALDRGEAKTFLIPMTRPKPGRYAIRLTTPLSPSADPRSLEQFIAPKPMPRLKLDYLAPTRARSGETGLIALVSIRGNAAPDLEASGDGADTARLAIVPNGETAVWVFRGATRFDLAYGTSEIHSVTDANPPVVAPYIRIIDFGGALPLSQSGVVRFVRNAGGETLPAGRVLYAVNGILRGGTAVPELAPGEKYFDAVRFTPATRQPIRVVLFEPRRVGARGVAMIDERTSEISDATDVPTRADWDWLGPVVWSPARRADPRASIYLRMAALAQSASEYLVPLRLTPVSPQPAREMESLRADTSALGRVAYRDQLAQLAAQWKGACLAFEGVRLPSTVDPPHVHALSEAIERTEALANDPGLLDKSKVERALENLESRIRMMLGLDVDEAYAGL